MHGNVWEWCQDWYGDYSADAVPDPDGLDGGSLRVLRGGASGNEPAFCRAALRDWGAPDDRLGNLGCRLVRAVP